MPIELKHNQIVRGFGFSRYASKITVRTSRGYASQYGACPESSHAECVTRGHATAWTNQKSSMICADYQGKAEAHEKELQEIMDSVILADNQIVSIEGEQFKVLIAGEEFSDPIHFKRI
jgi:hypothetical protein